MRDTDRTIPARPARAGDPSTSAALEWHSARLLFACMVGLARRLHEKDGVAPADARRIACERIVAEWMARDPGCSRAEAQFALNDLITLASQPEPPAGGRGGTTARP